jgi:hypothetical protein
MGVELLAVVLMIAAGSALAMLVIIARIGKGEKPHPHAEAAVPDRDRIAASLLFHVLTAGNVASDEALRAIRGTGLDAAVTRGIDVANWAERFAEVASLAQRHMLLESAVRLAVAHRRTVPLPQYAALLDLSFSLGFHTSALVNLREQYGFDYVDHTKDARPPEADRGRRTTFSARGEADPVSLLRVLELEGHPTRQAIISAYRRLATQHHPDRFHAESIGARNAAAARFIEITRAYETLMSAYGG